MKQNEKGFSVVEMLIALVMVGLIGTIGWLVYNRHKNDNKSGTGNASVTDNYTLYENTEFDYYYPTGTTLHDEITGSYSPAGGATSLLLSDKATTNQLQRIDVIEPVEFTNLDTKSAVSDSLKLNNKIPQDDGGTITFSDMTTDPVNGTTGYSYTMSADKPFSFITDFKELPSGSQGTYGGFMLGGADGGITKIKILMLKTTDGKLIRIVSDAKEARIDGILDKITVK